MTIHQKINSKLAYPALAVDGMHPAMLARASMADRIKVEAETEQLQLEQVVNSQQPIMTLRPPMAELIKMEASYMREQLRQPKDKVAAVYPSDQSLFRIRTANQCLDDASKQEIPQMLYGEFWYEGELSILFADTNTGKSIAGMQIADQISRGKSDQELLMEANAQKVIYMDFELNDKQFENRYTNYFVDGYNFNDNLLRLDFNPDFEAPEERKNTEEYLVQQLEEAIHRTGTKIVIIDNLTFLRTDNEQAKEAGALMKQLKKLKEKQGLSILILAHTPKRNIYKPLTVNDLQGSKMIANFSDSIWAIGMSSQGNDLRYLKQIKVRATAKRYGEDNVIICRIEKKLNFLGFTHVGYGRERDHLQVEPNSEREERNQQIRAMKAQNMSNVAIAAHFDISEGAVRKVLKQD